MTAAEEMVAAFEAAVEEHAFIGSIPLHHHDPDEQRAIDAERRRIKATYTRTRNRLIRALGATP